MILRRVGSALLLAAFLSACGSLTVTEVRAQETWCDDGDPNTPAPAAYQTALKDIEAQRATFLEAYTRRDPGGVSDLFDEQATFAGTLQPQWLVGKAAIDTLWETYFASWDKTELIFRGPINCFFGDTAVERGFILMNMVDVEENPLPGEAAIEIPVVTFIRYSITRIRTAEGWKIFNMNVSAL